MSEDAYQAYTATLKASLDPFALVFHVDLFLAAIVGVFALAAIPLAIARFSRAAEWRQGHILRSVRLDHRRPRRPPMRSGPSTDRNLASPVEAPVEAPTSEESHTVFSHTHLIRHPQGRPEGWSLPPHVRAWSAIVPPVGSLLRRRLETSFSVGQATILVVYFAVMVYASFLKSNPFADPLRTGIVAMSQIPVVYALATKNNILGMFMGLGYEKLNYIHRFAGLLIIIATNLHGLGYIYQWTFSGTFSKYIIQPANIWALVALGCLDLIYFFSTSFWRQKAYNVFFSTHVIGFVIFLPAAYGHQPSMLPYIIAAAAVYGFDHTLRLLKTRMYDARIRPISDMTLTRVEIPELNAGWRAGQHVRLRVLSSAMGWFGWAETHPFTIASVSKTPEGLVLMCKTAGGWTGKLYEMAKVASYGYSEAGTGRTVKVMVEGPYGGTGHSVFASFSAAIFVVGGSGITFALAAVQDLLQRDSEGASRVKIIEVIWSIPDPSFLTPLIPQFTALIQQSMYAPLKISVHYTRASSAPETNKEFLPPGLTLSAGRPKIGKILDAVISRAVSYGSGVKGSMDITGVVIGVCGPPGIGDEVSQVISAVDAGRRWAVGGIEMHEEVFGW
ncbi:hypothetical protein BJ138DRAFT_1082687 [Hygrophoropsis aurantiaca]|uniref:Uncharacterized protein n=1 Tax=Hygrophoropsis aurantiaca TaxID=72124 RepID=A0ACB8AHZ5_9AGAM|nr:hypothetical protein BJ138DRAFT_1082687 [Hygrophoropsis aurantiaca]